MYYIFPTNQKCEGNAGHNSGRSVVSERTCKSESSEGNEIIKEYSSYKEGCAESPSEDSVEGDTEKKLHCGIDESRSESPFGAVFDRDNAYRQHTEQSYRSAEIGEEELWDLNKAQYARKSDHDRAFGKHAHAFVFCHSKKPP